MAKRTESRRRPNASSLAARKDASDGKARSTEIAVRGIRTGGDFADFMSALMSDVVEGRVSPGTCNAACNAGGKLLKVVEMQLKYGTKSQSTNRELRLSSS